MRYRASRWACAFNLDVSARDGQRRVTVVNLSANGLRYRGELGARTCDMVRFSMHGTDITARVVWQEGEMGGLLFDRALKGAQFNHLRANLLAG